MRCLKRDLSPGVLKSTRIFHDVVVIPLIPVRRRPRVKDLKGGATIGARPYNSKCAGENMIPCHFVTMLYKVQSIQILIGIPQEGTTSLAGGSPAPHVSG